MAKGTSPPRGASPRSITPPPGSTTWLNPTTPRSPMRPAPKSRSRRRSTAPPTDPPPPPPGGGATADSLPVDRGGAEHYDEKNRRGPGVRGEAQPPPD